MGLQEVKSRSKRVCCRGRLPEDRWLSTNKQRSQVGRRGTRGEREREGVLQDRLALKEWTATWKERP